MITTVMGVGYLRPAPGTWGSAAALPWAWLLHIIGGPVLLLVAIVIGTIKAFWAIPREVSGDHEDPSEIVVDELIGQWIALLPVSVGAAHAGVSVTALWPGVLAAFVLFRLFDIWKPGLVGWADRKGGAFGIMLDDIIAGVFAAIGVGVLAWLSHGVLGF